MHGCGSRQKLTTSFLASGCEDAITTPGGSNLGHHVEAGRQLEMKVMPTSYSPLSTLDATSQGVTA